MSVHVTSMKINSMGRVDADVVVGGVKMHTILLATDPLIDEPLTQLRNAVIAATRGDLADILGLPLESVTDSSST